MIKDLECATCKENVGDLYKKDRTKGLLVWLAREEVTFVYVACDEGCAAPLKKRGAAFQKFERPFSEMTGGRAVTQLRELLSAHTWGGRSTSLWDVFEEFGQLPPRLFL